jgi:hypothetical protein
VARAIEQGVPENTARASLATRNPSFTELQDVMMDLRDDASAARASGRPNAARRATEAYDSLVEAMEVDIPGFEDAQRAFHLASKKLEGYQVGFDMWTKSAREIREALDDLPPDAQDSFRAGLLQRWEEKLLEKEGTSGAVSSILKAGEEMRDQIRAAFGDDESFRAFLAQRDLERTFGLTEAALSGNSSTAQQALDALDSAPTSKSQLLNRIYDAILSPGESRRMQAEVVGERLLGRDVQGFQQAIRPNRFGFGESGAGAGLGSAAGFAAGTRPGGERPERMTVDTLRSRVGQSITRDR